MIENSQAQKSLERLNEEQVKQLYMSLFNSENGKLVLEDLKNRCGIKTAYPIDGPMDPFRLAHFDGMRAVYLTIETMLKPMEKPATESEGGTDA